MGTLAATNVPKTASKINVCVRLEYAQMVAKLDFGTRIAVPIVLGHATETYVIKKEEYVNHVVIENGERRATYPVLADALITFAT